MKKALFTLMVCIFAIHMFGQDPKLVPEHIFDGLYQPYNMEIYNPISDDDRYFYPAALDINGGHIEGAIYNEDYSIRDRIDCIIDVPDGYKIGSVEMFGNMVLPDGTKFFIVTFTKNAYDQIGHADYAISKAYSYAQGNPLLFNIGSATYHIQPFSTLYVINGKISLIVLVYDQEPSNRYISHKTCVYSLGEAPSGSAMQIPQDGYAPYPIRTYDMNGRLINKDCKGIPIIIQYSDGSAIKKMK